MSAIAVAPPVARGAPGCVSTSLGGGATTGLPPPRKDGNASTRARAPEAPPPAASSTTEYSAGPHETAVFRFRLRLQHGADQRRRNTEIQHIFRRLVLRPHQESVLPQGAVRRVLHEHEQQRKLQRRRRALQPPVRVVEVGDGADIQDHGHTDAATTRTCAAPTLAKQRDAIQRLRLVLSK